MNYLTLNHGKEISYNYLTVDSLNNKILLRYLNYRYEIKFIGVLNKFLIEKIASYMLLNLYNKEDEIKNIFNVNFSISEIEKSVDTDYEKIYIKVINTLDNSIRLKYLTSHSKGEYDGTLTVSSLDVVNNKGNLINLMYCIFGECIYLNDLSICELETYLSKKIVFDDIHFEKNTITFYNNMNFRIFGNNLCLYFRNYFLNNLST